MTPLSRAPDTASGAWRARIPVYVIELDRGSGDIAVWEFYECGAVRFRDSHEDIEEWAPLADYEAIRE